MAWKEIVAPLLSEAGKLAGELIRTYIPKPRQEPEIPPAPQAQNSPKSLEVAIQTRPALSTIVSPVIQRAGLDPMTLAYQEDWIYAEVHVLLTHLKENCVGCSKDYNCCFSHCDKAIIFVNETLSMTSDPFLIKLKALLMEIQTKVHPDDVEAKTYVSEYPAFVVRLSEFWKVLNKKHIDRFKPKQVTLEEAKKIASEEAAAVIEREWKQSPKSSKDAVLK